MAILLLYFVASAVMILVLCCSNLQIATQQWHLERKYATISYQIPQEEFLLLLLPAAPQAPCFEKSLQYAVLDYLVQQMVEERRLLLRVLWDLDLDRRRQEIPF